MEKLNTKADVIVYAKTFDDITKQQVVTLGNCLAYADSKIRIMPDCHAGAGCTIGTTMTITDKITPNLVGVDISCGMFVVNIGKEKPNLETFDKNVKELIPSGFEIRKYPFNYEMMGKLKELYCSSRTELNLDRALLSIGTLGGGNHFIEIDYSELTGDYYLVIHTGSRNLGKQVCEFYQKEAQEALKGCDEVTIKATIQKLKEEGKEQQIQATLKNLKSTKLDNPQLAWLTGENFNNYLHDMKILQEYAHLNRFAIASILLKTLKLDIESCNSFETLHNYIDLENMILRKGAVRALKGEPLIIPMNMRDGSLICIGKGNPDWNYSAPHGAGRLMSRAQAKKELDLIELQKEMNGIYTTTANIDTIDEAPMAYKPMEEIIKIIEPTVDIVDIIKPIYNFKATE